MAAFPRSHVLSSSRRSQSLDDRPPYPTVIQQDPSDNTRLGKRPRHTSVAANELPSTKRQKNPPQNQAPSKSSPQKTDARPSATSSTVFVKDAGTQAQQPPDPDAVPLRSSINSSITTNGKHVTGRNTKSASAQTETAGDSDRRTLRSQAGGSRLKSELSWYFSNYDELVNDEPREPGKPIPVTLCP